MNILGVILARGGSKGVPRKNLKPLAGIPLLAYTILEAQGSARLSKLVVSSENDEILTLASRLGCETIKRPDELATDQAASPPCVMHAIEYLQSHHGFDTDIAVLLQPTTPFRTSQTIDGCIDLLLEKDADSVVSVMKAPHFVNPHWVRKLDERGFLKPYLEEKDFTRRQDLPQVYWRNGQVYAVKREVLFKTGDLYGDKSVPFVMNEEFHINIDAAIDFKFAEFLLQKRLIDWDRNFFGKYAQ